MYTLYMSFLKLITPINIEEEKRSFFSSSTYQPQLKYNWEEEKVAEIIKKRPTFIPVMDALYLQDGNEIIKAGKVFFDISLTDKHIQLAEDIVKQSVDIVHTDAQTIATELEKIFAILDINYSISIDARFGYQCRPQHKKKNISISKNAYSIFMTARSIALHETIHVIRFINGKHLGIEREENYLSTEEGLACLLQDYYSGEGQGSLFQHAVEYLAAYRSQFMGFREVYNFLLECGYSQEMAWERGIRQKYGIQDTGTQGSLLKSAMYFYHEQLLKEYSINKIFCLLNGKISIDSIANYLEYNGIIPIDKIKSIFTI